MNKTIRKQWIAGCLLIAGFLLWTGLIRLVDVQPLGANGTDVGFASLNGWFHRLTGVHMSLYTVTDWLGLVPVLVCLLFAGIGFFQLVTRRSLCKVDPDILILGGYYIIVICCYAVFEIFPVNYRPILINGVAEASYPSSTTLLVLGVMPTLWDRVRRRMEPGWINRGIRICTAGFSAFTVISRLICGVHWLTDIVGAAVLCAGLFTLYRAAVATCCRTN